MDKTSKTHSLRVTFNVNTTEVQIGKLLQRLHDARDKRKTVTSIALDYNARTRVLKSIHIRFNYKLNSIALDKARTALAKLGSVK